MNQETRAFLGMMQVAGALLKMIMEGPCGATDGLGLDPDDPEPSGRCNLPAGHDRDWHQEWRDGHLWAEWCGPAPGERCGVCGKDGSEH